MKTDVITKDGEILISRTYPDLGDQLDLLYHDMVSGKGDKTGEWFKAIKTVKDKYPKPE